MDIALLNDGISSAPLSPNSITRSMLAGRYLLQNILGIGGMGVVYRGIDTLVQSFGISHQIAIKMSCAEQDDDVNADKRLFMEYVIGSGLKHPNLVAIRHFDVCREQHKAFLIMDWLEGLPLEELLYRQVIPTEMALHFAKQLVDAVRHCHAQGIVHGDIKLANIIISPANHLTLFDFGISRQIYQPVSARQVVRACSCRYAAPELFEENLSTMTTDVFAVCCVLYRLFSGEHPFQDTTDEAAARGDIIKPIFNRRHPFDKALLQGLKWSHQERSCNLDTLHQVLAQLDKSDLKKNWLS